MLASLLPPPLADHSSGWAALHSKSCASAEWDQGHVLSLKLQGKLGEKVWCVLVPRVYMETSLVVQWLGVCLPMQRTQVWEDPTCRRAAKPVLHDY